MTTPLICGHCGNIWETKGRAYNTADKRWVAVSGNIQKCTDCGKADKIEILKGKGIYG